jgi:ankyrin repeat protein
MTNLLIHYSGTCQVEEVKKIIASGCDLNEKDELGSTALIHATIAECYEIIKILLEAGADVNQTDNFGQSALMFAVLNDNFECVELLLKSGAEFNLKTASGQKILDLAKKKRFRFEINGSMLAVEFPRLKENNITKILKEYRKIPDEK